jgi:hypothetical protein
MKILSSCTNPKMNRTSGLIPLIFFLSACATAPRYIPSGQSAARPPRTKEQIVLFYSDKDVSFPYTEIGRIFLNVRPHLLRHPADQIEAIREEAAAQGADAVILVPSNTSYSSGDVVGNRYGVVGGSDGVAGVMYSAIVIIKK